LGSLINPQKSAAAKIVDWDELAAALQLALAADGQDAEQQEAGIMAQGLAKAATLLAGQYSWVITSVHYLARGKQDEVLKDFCEKHYLLAAVNASSLEAWLRDKFFDQHCKLFGHRPFVWQVWDGLKDGFSALINYHHLNADHLDRLIYTYLGDWIRTQEQGVKSSIDGADLRLAAAKNLQIELEAIKHGEASKNGKSGYDIFVRWKPLHEQSIGWNPDLNDGVRLNIRPFMTAKDMGKKGAGILRGKPNIDWKKDRGTDVKTAPWYELGEQFGESLGARINDHHLTRAEKLAAQAAHAAANLDEVEPDLADLFASS
jgi:hypothetical protein